MEADLYLPAAGWGEKTGTQINSERRIGLTRRVRRPPGQALPDFEIFRLLAHAAGMGELFPRFSDPESTFFLMRDLSRGRPHDFGGVAGYAHLDAAGGVQWPYPPSDHLLTESVAPRTGIPETARSLVRGDEGHRRLFADGRFFTPDGRARLLFDPPRPPEETPDAEFDLVLLTGRGSSSEWHSGTRTSKSGILKALSPRRLVVQVNPADAAARGLASGGEAVVRSRRGELRAQVLATANVKVGSIFLPMHDRRVNRLTFPSFDPHSREPSYKHAAVRLEAPR
jgi:assimilatory nitrate reductase catalytic subunit